MRQAKCCNSPDIEASWLEMRKASRSDAFFRSAKPCKCWASRKVSGERLGRTHPSAGVPNQINLTSRERSQPRRTFLTSSFVRSKCSPKETSQAMHASPCRCKAADSPAVPAKTSMQTRRCGRRARRKARARAA